MADGLDKASLERNERGGKGTRRYDSTLRRAQAAQTRQTVLDAGHELFLDRGYGRTTMRDIAERAGVAVDSVYVHFRSKATLLRELMSQAHGPGGDVENTESTGDTAVADRAWVHDVRGRAGAREQLSALAANLAEVYRTLAPLTLALRRAADADDTAERIWAERNADRLAGLERFAARLADSGALRPGLGADEARDILYAVTAADLYGLLVLDRGWSPARYTGWLESTLHAQLLGQPGA